MRALPPLRPILLALALAACDTAEERAEAHTSAAGAARRGRPDRAMVEFRNVFRLNGDHGAARLAYAGLLRDRGEIGEAYGQDPRLVEQDPGDVAGHRGLAELALEIQDFATAALSVTGPSPSRPPTRRSGRSRPPSTSAPAATTPGRWRWRARCSPRPPPSCRRRWC